MSGTAKLNDEEHGQTPNRPEATRPAASTRRFEPVYSSAVGVGRFLFGVILGLKPKISGAESIPASGAAVLAITHFGYMDFALVEWVTWLRARRRIRYLVTKRAADKPVVGGLLRQMRHIPVDMSAGRDAYTHAVRALEQGELVGVFPEAGVSASFTVRDLKTGAVRMAAAAGVPVIPVVVWGGQLLRTKNHRARFREAFRAPIRVSVGNPIDVDASEDAESVTARLRSDLQALLDDAQLTYPRSGAGQWWQPAHLGGSAPTPAAAAVAEAERQRRKAIAAGEPGSVEPLAPGMRRIGKVMRRLPGSSVSEATPEQIARSSGASAPEVVASILMGRRPRSVRVADHTVEGVRVRVYAPATPGAGRPLILYFHGGGFVFGDLRGGDWMCGTVAKGLDAVVVSVEYRLAPQHPFPAGVEDCYAVLTWAAAHAAELGADGDRIGVMGESAGGNLAAVVALMARDDDVLRIRHQALLYPATGAGDTESRRANANAYILTAADMAAFGELYGGDVDDWRVSPLKADSLADLPATTVIVGGHDPLHDDGVRYADALRDAGVAVQLIEYPAMPHGFLNFPRFARDAKRAMTAVILAQQRALR